jgi:hypothetical protein
MDHMGGHEFSRVQTAVNDGVCVACCSFSHCIHRVGLPKAVFVLKDNLMRTNRGRDGGWWMEILMSSFIQSVFPFPPSQAKYAISNP